MFKYKINIKIWLKFFIKFYKLIQSYKMFLLKKIIIKNIIN